MTYNQFLDQFLTDLVSVFSWVKRNLFPVTPVGRSFYSSHLIFTIIGLGLIVTVIEELAGILSSFRFGGLLFRHFRVLYPRSYQVAESFPDYSKEKVARSYRSLFRPFYRQKYTGKYFISYNGKYYPVSVPRYNPFAIARFRSEYKAGNIIDYSHLYNSTYNQEYHGSIGRALAKPISKGFYSLNDNFFNYDSGTSSSGYAGSGEISLMSEDPSLAERISYSSHQDQIFNDGSSEESFTVDGGSFNEYSVSYEDDN